MQLNKHKTLLLYLGSSVCYQAVFFVCELVVLRLIDPELIGLWQLALLIKSYLMVTRMGILNAMNREYPYLNGRNEQQEATYILETTQVFTFFNGLILFIVFVIIAVFFNKQEFDWNLVWFVTAIVVFADLITSYMEAVLRSKLIFDKISLIRVALIPVLIATLILPYKFNFTGFCLRYLLIASVKLVLLLLVGRVRVKFRFSFNILAKLFYVGWRLWLWNYAKSFSKTVPRLLLVSFSSVAMLGLFAPVNWLYLAFGSVAGIVSSYIYPKYSYRYGKNKFSAGRASVRAGYISLLLMTPLTIIGIIAMPTCVLQILPKYLEAVPAMQASLIAGWLDVFLICTNAFAITKAWKAMFCYIGCAVVLRSIACSLGYFIFDDKLLGVAIGMIISNALLVLLAWVQVGSIGMESEKTLEAA